MGSTGKPGRFWKRLFRTAGRHHAVKAEAQALRSVSRPEDSAGLRWNWERFIPLPNQTPFEMLGVYRHLRDVIPDVSDAVWTWKRLCHAGHEVLIEGSEENAARQAVSAFANRVNADDGGLPGLLDVFYASLFTYGAAAFEVVPGRAREWVHDLVPVDIWTVRFRYNRSRIEAHQLFEGESIQLPGDYFLYVGLDRDGTNPYGRSMLRSLPAAISIQQQLLSDMALATHNAGWNKLHVQYKPEEPLPDETPEAYQERMRLNLGRLRDLLSSTKIDQNLVTFDNVGVAVLGGHTHNQVFYENHKAVEEQVITGMHMMPVLMGRNYGSTETYGTAQFEVVNRQVETVNRRVGALLERIYNLELALQGIHARARVIMRSNRTVDVLKEAHARSQEIAGTLQLLNAGLIDKAEAKKLTTF
jgi:hypothetical protein